MKLNHRFQTASAVAAAIVLIGSAACTSSTTSATAPSANKCQVSATATPPQFPPDGGSGQLSVTAARDCSWSINSPAGWVTVNGERSGNGSATLPFTVLSNPAPAARSAELLVDEVRVGVIQAAAPCTFSLKRTSDAVGAAGGIVSLEITTLTGCSWTASSAASWLALARASGQSSASVEITVAPNTGAARSGSVTAGGQVYTVRQADGTAPPVPPTTPPPTSPAPTPSPTPSPTPTPTPDPSPTPPPPPPASPVTLSGAVSAMSGSCPSLRFRVDGRDVATDGSTDFNRGKCRDMSDGDTVKVTGLTQTSGAVLASTVEITRNER